MLLCYHCFIRSVPVIFPKCKLNSAKNTPWKWYHLGLPRLKRDFNGLRHLSNSQIISLQIPTNSLTCLLKNMVALENLAPSENLAPPAPLIIQPPLIVRLPPWVLKSSPQSHIFFQARPPLLPRGGGSTLWSWSLQPISSCFASLKLYRTFKPYYTLLWTIDFSTVAYIKLWWSLKDLQKNALKFRGHVPLQTYLHQTKIFYLNYFPCFNWQPKKLWNQ